MTDRFDGFQPEAFQFLVDLAANNERTWFQPRKADFERVLKGPMEALCVALDAEFKRRELPMTADPAKSPYRIYRDVRFAKDKSPYKTNLGASFPWQGGGGYFHLSPEETFVGGGYWHPMPSWLGAWRRLVDGDPEKVHAALDDADFRARYPSGLIGHALTRMPAGYISDHPDAALLKLTDVGFSHSELSAKVVGSAKLPVVLADAFEAAAPVFRLLATVQA